MVLEKTLESPLDCKGIQPVHPKGNQSWVFIESTDVETEIPILWPPEWPKELTHLKRPWCWEGLGAGPEGDDRGWDGWMASLTLWTWVWVDSGSWWWTGRPGVLWFIGSQSVRHDSVTELTELKGICWETIEHFLMGLHPAATCQNCSLLKASFLILGPFKVPQRRRKGSGKAHHWILLRDFPNTLLLRFQSFGKKDWGLLKRAYCWTLQRRQWDRIGEMVLEQTWVMNRNFPNGKIRKRTYYVLDPVDMC